jgi:hypothetical protein
VGHPAAAQQFSSPPGGGVAPSLWNKGVACSIRTLDACTHVDSGAVCACLAAGSSTATPGAVKRLLPRLRKINRNLLKIAFTARCLATGVTPPVPEINSLPKISHTMRRNHVAERRLAISPGEIPIPKIGTSGITCVFLYTPLFNRFNGHLG